MPQAIDGAFQVNPTVYDTVPLHVATAPEAERVTVDLAGQPVEASFDSPGVWLASLPVGGLADGVVEVTATAEAAGAEPVSVSAELVVSRTGVQLSDYFQDGFAGAPRLHRRDGALWLTFTDRHEPNAEAWLRQLDGGGRWMGDRIRLVGSDQETLYARTAFGGQSIGVLYQQHGQPYRSFFKIVDFDGSELMAPLALDPVGTSGTFGGDVDFDGTSFQIAWRTEDATEQQLHWLRVTEAGHAVTGPVTVTRSGAGTAQDIVGPFPPFSFVDVVAIGPGALISFVRGRYHDSLDAVLPKSQLALIRNDGSVLWTAYAGIENDLTFHREARLFPFADTVLVLSNAANLAAPEDPAPNWFYTTRTDSAGELDPLRSSGDIMLEAPGDRDEPFFLEHPYHRGVLAWLDHRAYVLDPPNGRIELYVAPVDSSLQVGEPAIFAHARVFAGLTQLRAGLAGANALLVWLDQRHSAGLDGIQEMWFDTAWLWGMPSPTSRSATAHR